MSDFFTWQCLFFVGAIDTPSSWWRFYLMHNRALVFMHSYEYDMIVFVSHLPFRFLDLS